MSFASEKEKFYLKKIVENYISTGEAVASKTLKEAYNLNVSSSTIRSFMLNLEKKGFLEKSHISSGRIPTLKAYEYYANVLVNDNDEHWENKIINIFNKRRTSIDFTIEEAVNAISEITNLTIITSTSSDEERIRSISLTPIDKNSGVIILVTSTGRVENKTINFSKFVQKEDVKVAVRVFNERLYNVPIEEIEKIIKLLAPILSREIKNIDFVIQTFVQNIFNFKKYYKSEVFNKNDLILSKEISREKIAEILDLVEKKSIWESIEAKYNENNNLKIKIDSKETAFISKKMKDLDGNFKEITFIGAPKKIDYTMVLTTLKVLEKFLKKK
ncbi:heat-inducible transcriptional repressor HrcA [Mesomycoplasma neurolyticum]|uniref:Heat-inducible transcription repressor HrcA n=1 Tax=Mesomycoplasma neurolyticum TaxID=2120 RepID=A0A449A621_9BACT|nr:heat-inducible transcriptional repressor HrcA [Mesomycoplasma neurolyticum]VEU59686.1 heat inducible transcription repressor HrcA [Mesomycoplasma neurolyticum]